MPFGPIGGSWLFGLLSSQLKKPKDAILSIARSRIENLDFAVQKRTCESYGGPRRLAGWLLRKNGILVAENQGISDYGILVAVKNGSKNGILVEAY